MSTHPLPRFHSRYSLFTALALGTLMQANIVLPAHGQVSIPSYGSLLSENFDHLSPSAPSSALPVGWAFVETGSDADGLYVGDDGSSSAGNTYSYGRSGSHERALGGLRGADLVTTFGAQFQNNTSEVMLSIRIDYFGEEWRLGVRGRSDQLDFQISTDATSLTTGTWTDVNTLDFVSPNTSQAGRLDGNTPENRRHLKADICGLSIAPGGTFWIRWTSRNPASTACGLAVDDFNLVAYRFPTTVTLDGPSEADCGQKVVFTANMGQSVVGAMMEFRDGPSLLATVPVDGSGIAQVSLTQLQAGSHSITAQFPGWCQLAPSAPSNKIAIEIASIGATVALTAPAQSTCGNKIVLHAEVQPPGTTGNVEFLDGATSLGFATTDANGVADLSITTLTNGSHSLTALFEGSVCYPSNKVNHDVVPLTFAFSLDAPSSSACGDKIVLHAQVGPPHPTCQELCLSNFDACSTSAGGDPDLMEVCRQQRDACLANCGPPSGAKPPGSVEFFDGTTSLGTVPTDANGVADLSVTGLPAGSHSLTAVFTANDPCYPTTTSNKIAHDIPVTTTTTTLSVPAASSCGETVVLHAQVSTACMEACEAAYQTCVQNAGGDSDILLVCANQRTACLAACPTLNGSVEFFDGVTSLAVLGLDGSGAADLSVTYFTIGSHSLTAVYSGDNCNTGSSSSKLVHDVSALTASISLSPPLKSSCGDKVVLHAEVGSAACVQRCEDAHVNCTSACGGDPDCEQVCHDLRTTCLAGCTQGPTPSSGSVEFFDGATSLGSVAIDGYGVAEISLTGLTVGQHSLTATFTDACYTPATSSKVVHEVNPVKPALIYFEVTPGAGKKACGEKVIFYVSMTPTETAGSIEFFDGTVSLGVVPLDAGIAQLSVTSLAPGVHTLKAVYSGSICHTSVFAELQHELNGFTTASVLTAPAQSSCGDKIVLHAQVATTGSHCTKQCLIAFEQCMISAGGDPDTEAFCRQERDACLAGCPLPPPSGGSVEFFDGTNSLGTVPIDGNGAADLSLTSLAPGSHSLTAVYGGLDCHAGSASGKVTHDVTPVASSVTLAADPNPAKFGTKVLLTAVASPAGLGGAVEFRDGTTSLGSVPVDANGLATLSVTTFATGSHLLEAHYTGGCAAPSSAGPLKLDIVPDLPPQVTVIAPNGGEVFYIGTVVKLAWTATDDNEVTSVDLHISRDYGALWEKVASAIPNSGTYLWTVTPPATNTDAVPVFSALLRADAHDNAAQTGTDASDEEFAIHDLATPTLVRLFQAEPVFGGIELRWQLESTLGIASLTVERAGTSEGPWAVVEARTRVETGVTVALDPTVEAGETYYYRLVARSTGGSTWTVGSLSSTAEKAILEFALTSVAPNPGRGPIRVAFAVPRESSVKLGIVDILGRQVAVLTEGVIQPGNHHVAWSGRTERGAAPPGIYFVTFQTPDRKLVRRFALSN